MLVHRGAVKAELLLVEGRVSGHPKFVEATGEQSRRLTLMLDTGASHCAVLESLLVGLGPLVGTTPVRTLRDSVELPVYRVGISLFLTNPSGAEIAVGDGLSVIAVPPRPSG